MKNYYLIILFSLSLTTALFAKPLKIGFYNLENLFDTKHDIGHKDWTHTPYTDPQKITGCLKIKYHWYRKKCFKTNWTKENLAKKINAIKEMIGAEGLDLLAVSEVENLNVLKMLAEELGFKNVLIGNGKDARGIHNGLLFNERLKFLKKTSHYPTAEYFSYFKTRSLFEVKFLYKKEVLSVFVNHWPSQHKSTFSRVLLAKFLNKLVKNRGREKIIALGDFNTIEKEQKLFKFLSLKELKHGFKGTYYLRSKKKWENLDRVFLSKNLFRGTGLRYKKDSFRAKYFTKKGRMLKAKSFKASDHLPLILTLH